MAGKTTFKEEFVTAGGVRLAEVDPVDVSKPEGTRTLFCGRDTGCGWDHGGL